MVRLLVSLVSNERRVTMDWIRVLLLKLANSCSSLSLES
jgi:hypothetical protein